MNEKIKSALYGIYLFDSSFEDIKEILTEKGIKATDKEIFDTVNELTKNV